MQFTSTGSDSHHNDSPDAEMHLSLESATIQSEFIFILYRAIFVTLDRKNAQDNIRHHREYNLVLLFWEGECQCITFLNFWWLSPP